MSPAPFFERLAAHWLDTVLLAAVVWVIQLAIAGAGALLLKSELDPLMQQLLGLGLHGSIAIVYYGWGHLNWGTTVGKRLFQLYVVRVGEERRITLKQSVVRCFSYALSYSPLGAGFWMALVHPRRQALHDWIAGTQVVKITGKNSTTSAA